MIKGLSAAIPETYRSAKALTARADVKTSPGSTLRLG
jgi:hypothetical protein